ncbi:MAG: LysM peptidoglycan-binding domain-containing protein [Bacilli bacterium]|nr:LysM peptidoglycan-binding domain-containing protein [Bacilli bacterium]
MKKKVTFEKKINFPTMIGEVCAISLEQNLKFVNESEVEGDLLLTGKYKLTEASRLEEDFSYSIPAEIVLTEKLDLNTVKIEITDFYYEIENEDTMVCHIELLVEGNEFVSEKLSDEERECDGEIKKEEEIEIPVKENGEVLQEDEKVDDNITVDNNDKSLFFNFQEDQETYGTFLVYIVRQNETINTIIEKYNTNLEELEKYNDLNNLGIGTKLIIPVTDND